MFLQELKKDTSTTLSLSLWSSSYSHASFKCFLTNLGGFSHYCCLFLSLDRVLCYGSTARGFTVAPFWLPIYFWFSLLQSLLCIYGQMHTLKICHSATIIILIQREKRKNLSIRLNIILLREAKSPTKTFRFKVNQQCILLVSYGWTDSRNDCYKIMWFTNCYCGEKWCWV